MATRFSFVKGITRVSPPWLRRLVGAAVLEGIGDEIETQIDRTVEGLRKRFPDAASPEALGFLGRERRILRGPGEDGVTYAARLIQWWDSHLLRGGPFALLTQLHQFFLASNNVPITLIYNSGTSLVIDIIGAITRGSIPGWTGDGEFPNKWARFVIIFELTTSAFAVPMTTEGGDEIFTEDGQTLLADVSIYALVAEDFELICSVPREWNAAHVDKILIVLLPPGGIVWGFPPADWGDVGLTWGGNLAVTFECI